MAVRYNIGTVMQNIFLTIYLLVTGIIYSVSTFTVLAQAASLVAESEKKVVVNVVPKREVRIVVVPSIAVTETEDLSAIENSSVETVSNLEVVKDEGQIILATALGVVEEKLFDKAAPVSEVADELPFQMQNKSVFTVPFYSQFTDISSPSWQKVGCGIASVAMLISFYENEEISVDDLLKKGIAANAFLSDAGWIHSGLINLSHEFGLDGESKSMANLSMGGAFSKLTTELEKGPVMASVRYKFEPTNPIPHLVVVNGVHDGKVFYNDPAESSAGGSVSIDKFKKAWKKRYITIRPIS